MEAAYETVRPARGREDLRGQLSSMAKLAHRHGWLDRSIDPLEGLTLPKSNKQQGAADSYVDPDLRPETRQVNAMAAAADELCGPNGEDPQLTRLPLFGTKIRVGGYGGLRLGEQNALRAVDVFFDKGWVHVNGSWVVPRKKRKDGTWVGTVAYRKGVKNGVVHEVPLPRSLMEELLPRVRELLGLPARATVQQVVNAQRAERQRRAAAARATGDPELSWWNYPVDPDEEAWLFVDTVTGLPVRPEAHNDRWHRIRRWVDEHDPENAWPQAIVYRNLRHHAATKWFHETLSEEWEAVAQYLGDTLQTVLAHYVRTGQDTLRKTVDKLSAY
jgi:integrase